MEYTDPNTKVHSLLFTAKHYLYQINHNFIKDFMKQYIYCRFLFPVRIMVCIKIF